MLREVHMKIRINDLKKPTYHQKRTLRLRQLDPENYLVIMDTRTALIVYNIRTRTARRIEKRK